MIGIIPIISSINNMIINNIIAIMTLLLLLVLHYSYYYSGGLRPPDPQSCFAFLVRQMSNSWFFAFWDY